MTDVRGHPLSPMILSWCGLIERVTAAFEEYGGDEERGWSDDPVPIAQAIGYLRTDLEYLRRLVDAELLASSPPPVPEHRQVDAEAEPA